MVKQSDGKGIQMLGVKIFTLCNQVAAVRVYVI